MRIAQNAVNKIVEESSVVSTIMVDLMVEIPEMFKLASFKKIKALVVDYICNPSSLSEDSNTNKVFINVIKRNLPIPEKRVSLTSESRKIANSLRARAVATMKGSEDCNFLEILGCSKELYLEHLSSQFEPGMSFENHGVDTWHIDHIVPLCSFDLTDPEQVKKASHFSNLRPLWAKDNWEKAQQDRKLSIRKRK